MRFPAMMAAVLAMQLPATAQTTGEVSPEDLWERFLQTCTAVMTDPDSYLASLVRPGPAGERIISVTPDRMAVSVFYRIGNVYDEVELYRIGDRQIRDCAVIGEYYEMETQNLVVRLKEIVATSEAVELAGGHAPQDYAQEGRVYTVDDVYMFAIDGLWPESGEIAVAQVIGGELQLTMQYVTTPDN